MPLIFMAFPFMVAPGHRGPPGRRHYARVRHGEVAGRVKRNLLPPPGLSSTQMPPS